ncbi:MAG: hypothetical protein C0403_07390 [Desulfobacterium sp.]|nr:hypothetical protein [Desulfobacterium sp.]
MTYKPLLPEDYNLYKPFFRNQRFRLCVYSLPSLIVWSNHIYHPHASIWNDSLVIFVQSGTTEEKNHIILPIAPGKNHNPKELHRIAADHQCSQIRFVTEEYIQSHGPEQIKLFFYVYEESEFEDYIYRTEDLAELKGNQYSKKRNLINQFEREYLKHDRVVIETITRDKAEECIEFLEKWCEERGCDDIERREDLACEKIAALNAIGNIDHLEMNGILVRVDNIVSAFGIASHLTDSIGVLHFEKAFASLKGLYQYFDRECARQLFQKYTYINKESDMGLPGLAKAKKSYYPVMREKAYKLVLK